jgi:ketosteroid isomerase-like protein
MATNDPRTDALHGLLGAFEVLDFERIGRMVADDAVFEFPYGGHPPLDGRAAILAHLNTNMASFVSAMTFTIQAIYPAEDPELVFAEYTSVGRLTNGGDYANRYIASLRVRDGLIRCFKEFYNPAAIARTR